MSARESVMTYTKRQAEYVRNVGTSLLKWCFRLFRALTAALSTRPLLSQRTRASEVVERRVECRNKYLLGGPSGRL